MKQHFLCVFVIGLAIQASSIAAVRAEWSGNASGETTREVNADAGAENAVENKTASEDLQVDSSKAVAAPTLNNNNIINVETGSAAKAASNQGQAQAQDQGQNQNQAQLQNQRVAQRTEVAYRGGENTEVEYVSRREREHETVSVTPMLGASFWRGAWKMDVSNDYTFGLLLDFPVSSIFSIETEGGYGSYQMRYAGTPFGHHFDQYMAGLNGKLYLSRSWFRPYIGLGMDALYYQGMSYGPFAPNGFAGRGYNQWVGAGQVLTGFDIRVSDSISLGARGTYSQPLINRPTVTTIPGTNIAAAGCEEAGAIDTGFYRAMGTVKVSF